VTLALGTDPAALLDEFEPAGEPVPDLPIDALAPWTGFAVFCGYAAVALTAGLVLFGNRDA
jgi:ABC-2 type transport system permease protein